MKATLVLGIVGSLVTLSLLFEMMRRQRLREKYAVFWALVAVVTLLVAAFPGLLTWASALVGVTVPANLLFFLASMLLLVVSVQHSSELGRLEERTRTLAEEIGLLRLQLQVQPEAREQAELLAWRPAEPAPDRDERTQRTTRSCPRRRWRSPTAASRCWRGACAPCSSRPVPGSTSWWSTTAVPRTQWTGWLSSPAYAWSDRREHRLRRGVQPRGPARHRTRAGPGEQRRRRRAGSRGGPRPGARGARRRHRQRQPPPLDRPGTSTRPATRCTTGGHVGGRPRRPRRRTVPRRRVASASGAAMAVRRETGRPRGLLGADVRLPRGPRAEPAVLAAGLDVATSLSVCSTPTSSAVTRASCTSSSATVS